LHKAWRDAAVPTNQQFILHCASGLAVLLHERVMAAGVPSCEPRWPVCMLLWLLMQSLLLLLLLCCSAGACDGD
jgi:hypothetical protein